ncbi:MAG: hypothetical protein WC327_02055 [Candidatus Cloacimonadia bacterium]
MSNQNDKEISKLKSLKGNVILKGAYLRPCTTITFNQIGGDLGYYPNNVYGFFSEEDIQVGGIACDAFMESPIYKGDDEYKKALFNEANRILKKIESIVEVEEMGVLSDKALAELEQLKAIEKNMKEIRVRGGLYRQFETTSFKEHYKSFDATRKCIKYAIDRIEEIDAPFAEHLRVHVTVDFSGVTYIPHETYDEENLFGW